MKDYYYILGLDQDAELSQIKKAYRKLSVKFHPDKNENDPFFEERFKDIQEAYTMLTDTNKKIIYDHELKRFLSGNAGYKEPVVTSTYNTRPSTTSHRVTVQPSSPTSGSKWFVRASYIAAEFLVAIGITYLVIKHVLMRFTNPLVADGSDMTKLLVTLSLLAVSLILPLTILRLFQRIPFFRTLHKKVQDATV